MLNSGLRRALCILMLAALQGCASMDLKMAASQPAPDWIYVHADARPGDRAVWSNRARLHHQMVWEVVARHGDDVEVTLAWRDEAGSPGSEQSGLRRHFIVAPDGKVKRAYARNHKTGNEVAMRVAAPGEVITKREMTMLSTPQIIETPAGTYEVDRVLLQHYHYKVMVTSLDTATVEFIDPKARFGVVRSMQNIEIGGLFIAKLVADLGAYSIGSRSPLSLANTLRQLDLSDKVRQDFELEQAR